MKSVTRVHSSSKFQAQTKAKTLTGFDDSLTPQQKLALEDLKSRLNASKYSSTIASFHDTRFLLRFLRATMKAKTTDRIFDTDATEHRGLQTL